MFRYLRTFLFLLVVSCGIAPTAFASEEPVIGKDDATIAYPAPGYGGTPLILGQQHSYTVTVRSSKNTSVVARIAFSNLTDKPLSELRFTSKVAIDQVVAYTQLLPKPCLQYDYTKVSPTPPCLEYGDPDYTIQYYQDPFRPAKYTTLQTRQENDALIVTLSPPLQPGNSSAVVLSYHTQGFVGEWLGLYNYKVVTLAATEPVESSRVSIQTDSDLYLGNAQSSVAYKTDETTALAPVNNIAAAEVDRLSYGMPGINAAYKEGKNIAAGEYFTVTGSYAKSFWRLHLPTIILVLAALLIAAYGIARLFMHQRRKTEPDHSHPVHQLTARTSTPFADLAFNPFITSFLASILIGGLVGLGIYLYSRIGYYFYSPSLLWVAIVLLAILITVSAAFLAAVRGGWKLAMYSIVAETLWLFIFTIIALFFFILYANPFRPNMVEPMPMDAAVPMATPTSGTAL